ncbi:MAG: SDR family NAD(P)-dependent oxidoreductase [Bacteroidota bacterium]
MSRIVVTGGNRGIGKEIAKQLVELGNQVLLTARDKEKGEKAAREIGASFYQLDVSMVKSIQAFSEKLDKEFDFIDVLINNAGVFIDDDKSVMNIGLETIKQTMDTNVYGPWSLIQKLHPVLIKSNDPRIINMSSGLGAIEGMAGDHPSYRMSKAALNILTMMVHNQLGEKIKINSMCPGWVQTDMGGSGAHRSVEKGAETAVWLATDSEIPNGKFLRDKEVIGW